MTYWQVGAGKPPRDYSDMFLKFGIMLIGPGRYGSYVEKKEFYTSRDQKDSRGQIRRFAEGLTEDEDYIVLRKGAKQGKWEIQAVGKVRSEYKYLEQFEDVEGGDIQHCRLMEWKQPRERVFTEGLSQGTFLGIQDRKSIDTAKRVWEEGKRIESEEIPPQAKSISEADLIETLVNNGLRSSSAETIFHRIQRLRQLGKWYQENGQDLSEHEARTFMIAPLMLALGWSEQEIKIEWNKIDMAFFQRMYKKGKKPRMILESKRMGIGLHGAKEQLLRYVADYPGCRRRISSDGIRYQLYVKQENKWDLKKDFQSYMNLLHLKDRHPYLKNIGGAPDFCINLMPR